MLTPEEQERMIARLQGNTVEEPQLEELEAQEAEPEYEEEAEYEEEDTSVEQLEADDDEEEDEDGGHAVPYQRFRQINERRKELQSTIETQGRQLQELQEQLNAKYQQPERQQPSYSDELEYEEADPDDWSKRFGAMEQSNKEMQVRIAHMDLQKEIADVQREYPDVPVEYMWDAIAQNGNLSAHDAATQYNGFVSEVEEAAIARYISNQGGQVAHGAPPRPRSQQTASSDHLAEPQAPRDMDEAREAMVRYLAM